MEAQIIKSSREKEFVAYVLARMKKDTRFRAMLSRADNPATAAQAWEFLIPWCDIVDERQRLAFATTGAAMARAKPEKDGGLGIGRAIAECYRDGSNDDQAKAKLRRLLACDSIKVACGILRSLLRLCNSRGVRLSYEQLLRDLLRFGEKTRIKWATEFYPRREHDRLDA